MAYLTAFNYLRPSRPLLLARVAALRIPVQLHAASFALGAALLTVWIAGEIERFRLVQAQRIEAVYRRHLEIADGAVKRTHIYAERVAALVALDEHVHIIQASGEATARRLADIANQLPAHAWLTSMSQDGTAIDLEGVAQSMRVVGSVMSALAHTGSVRDPLLTSASAAAETPGGRRMKYALTAEMRP